MPNSLQTELVSAADGSMSTETALYRRMAFIRAFEEGLLDAFSLGDLRGTTHTSIGQEAQAAASMSQVGDRDVVFSNHRCHGHFLAYGGDPEQLLLEIMGAPGGVCEGIGGSQHLHFRNFFSNGIQGGIVPNACGAALAEKLRGENGLAVVFLGDGTLGEGVVYESFNLASLWSLPVLFLIENNRISQSTRQEDNLAGEIAARPRAFGIETAEHFGNDARSLTEALRAAFDHVRSTGRPFCQVMHTARLGPHSKGDDPRGEDEMARLREGDPLVVTSGIPDSERAAIRQAAQAEVAALFESARLRNRSTNARSANPATDGTLVPLPSEPMDGMLTGDAPLGVEHLRDVLHRLMEDPTTFLIGEDLLDPYGGAFKASKGLSTKYPQRVLTTPISEAAITGIAAGAALRGMRAIAEIMFGDFTTLSTDQLVNHAAKFTRMYGRTLKVPLVLRTPMGGYRGYGPTHSQSLEKLFLGVPGLVVTAFSPVHDAGLIFERMFELGAPAVYVENKLLYGQRMLVAKDGRIGDFQARSSRGWFPTISMNLTGFDQEADVVILTYGGMTPFALDAARRLFIEEEAAVEVYVFSLLSPLPQGEIDAVLKRGRRFVTLEEGSLRSGWGAEMSARLHEHAQRPIRVERVAAQDTIIPGTETGEAWALPSLDQVVTALRRAMAHG
jgi:2-oxoisovalerate dehydrogenase E1 component